MSNSFTFLPKNDKLNVQFWKVPDNCSETGHSSLVSRDIRFEETFAAGPWVHGILARRSSLLLRYHAKSQCLPCSLSADPISSITQIVVHWTVLCNLVSPYFDVPCVTKSSVHRNPHDVAQVRFPWLLKFPCKPAILHIDLLKDAIY